MAIKPTPHGTINGYQNYGCRCDLCNTARKEYHKPRYRALSELKKRHIDEYREILAAMQDS